ncbi:hypothetical protein [Streptomyces tailanensis]|uniref:hypothetical protein n=1 Tax=Streptomyces tailanensis TaxID=2569858 RepID=UPI00155A56A3|nr:hypothetical protein [Streptomyces tailanensis]
MPLLAAQVGPGRSVRRGGSGPGNPTRLLGDEGVQEVVIGPGVVLDHHAQLLGTRGPGRAALGHPQVVLTHPCGKGVVGVNRYVRLGDVERRVHDRVVQVARRALHDPHRPTRSAPPRSRMARPTSASAFSSRSPGRREKRSSRRTAIAAATAASLPPGRLP